MKVEVMESGNILLKEVYNGLIMETEEGNQISICMRDDTFEINIMPHDKKHCDNWHRIDMGGCLIKPMRDNDND